MVRFLLICLGGAIGTGARYLTSLWAQRALGSAFPFGTLLVNLTGAFLIEVIVYVSLAMPSVSPTTRLVLTTGVMGGLTTYSSFNHETLEFALRGGRTMAALNLAVTTVGCLLAGLLGLLVARRLVPA